MSHWNHRVIRQIYTSGDYSEESFGIHEVYCDDNGKIWGCTKNSVGIHAESLEGLKKVFGWMQKALELPVINIEDIPEEGAIAQYY